MDEAQAGPSLSPFLPEPLLDAADLHTVGDAARRLALTAEQVGHDALICAQRTDLPAFPAVAGTLCIAKISHKNVPLYDKKSVIHIINENLYFEIIHFEGNFFNRELSGMLFSGGCFGQ